MKVESVQTITMTMEQNEAYRLYVTLQRMRRILVQKGDGEGGTVDEIEWLGMLIDWLEQYV